MSSTTVSVPEYVEIFLGTDTRDMLMVFLQKLRNATLIESAKSGTVIIDFSDTVALEARGMILLYAELKRLHQYFGTVRFIIQEARQKPRDSALAISKKRLVNEVLDHLGLLRQFGCPKRFPSTKINVVQWQHFQLDIVDMERVLPLLKELENHITEQSSSSLESGLAEVIDNAVAHAYCAIRPDGLDIDDEARNKRNWYLFTHIHKARLMVVLADLGVGIPYTLPMSNPGWNKVLDRLVQRAGGHYREEGNAIKYAFKHGNSRTGLPHRGTGLPKLVQTIEKVPGVELTILSNRGAYNFSKGHWQVPMDAKTSINGTLVTWWFPLRPSPQDSGVDVV